LGYIAEAASIDSTTPDPAAGGYRYAPDPISKKENKNPQTISLSLRLQLFFTVANAIAAAKAACIRCNKYHKGVVTNITAGRRNETTSSGVHGEAR